MDNVQRGQRSEQLLTDPLLVETLELIEEAIIEQWTGTNDTTLREQLWYTLQGQKRFKTVLEAAIENGKLDAHLGDRQ